jgi:hypothetical protein
MLDLVDIVVETEPVALLLVQFTGGTTSTSVVAFGVS